MKSGILRSKFFAAGAALFCCALWGISTPIVKMGYTFTDAAHVPSLILWVGLQFLASGCLTIGFYSLVSKRFVVPKRNSLKGVALISLLQTVLQYALLYVGLSYTTSVKGAILKSTDVFMVVLIASLIFRQEALTPKKLLSCLIGFAGIIVMNLDGLSLNFHPLGDGLVLLAMVSYSFSAVLTKTFAREEDPIVLSGWQMTIGGAVMTLAGTLLHGNLDFVGMLPVFVCLSAIYAVSYTLWTVLLKHHPTSSITIFSFMTPVFGVAFSALLLTEDSGVAPLSLAIALVLVCAGILLWGYEKKTQPVGKTPSP